MLNLNPFQGVFRGRLLCKKKEPGIQKKKLNMDRPPAKKNISYTATRLNERKPTDSFATKKKGATTLSWGGTRAQRERWPVVAKREGFAVQD